MIEIEKITKNLMYHNNGILVSNIQSNISYPLDGNDNCFSIEKDSFWFRHRNNCIIESITQFPTDDTIFDVGAGNGYVSLAIKKAGIDVIVVEPGMPGAINAKKRGLPLVICSTLENAGFKPNSIPSIGLFDVLEHIENDIDFLVSIKKLMVPTGRIYITVPAYQNLWSTDDDNAGHFRRYTKKSLASLLESAGFIIEFQTHIFSILPLPIFLLRTIPSMLGIRKDNRLKRKNKEHIMPNKIFSVIINSIFNYEINSIRNKRELPFGGSCLMVARLLG